MGRLGRLYRRDKGVGIGGREDDGLDIAVNGGLDDIDLLVNGRLGLGTQEGNRELGETSP